MLRLDTRFLPDFPQAFKEHGPLLLQAREALLAKRKDPQSMLGWMDLPEDTETLRRIRRYREANPWVEDFVLLGIGGSALGPKALESAFNESGVRFHYVDHVEPEPVLRLLRGLDPRKTLVNAVSKSGATAETLAALLVFLNWLRENLGEDWRRHLVLTTDPRRGALRALAEKEGLEAFSIPDNVGGRFSVLSPVGLLPLAFAGMDLEALLMGARKANELALAPLEENLPLKTALLQHLHRHLPITVFMVYSERLKYLPAWFVQLHDESLGKRDGEGNRVGTTAVPALGPQDQHAQVQLFREGPLDKLIVLVVPERATEDLLLPQVEGLEGEAGYLFGKGLFQLLKAEAEATYQALAEAGQKVYTLYLSEISPYTVGWLLQHLMWQTAFLGELWGVNAFDQPGVELGKRLTLTFLERPGYEF
ncbi:glucose-6-phosphate isomerase [Thermus scotoductus]|uniref:Glucose-6-phosphate isomerase n=1 Tax=Thermus scotoductus TaxID=37636 RepID=A0A430RS48_THESC|nr:glucose-6-phosphate isomerase [Thermus scotoductus]RTG92012.1 glucose-6-phosphate isomerase [Thermus scotoductus]RTH22159.1 glucose-6-phosphate isomerase [Thermus scotoductus]